MVRWQDEQGWHWVAPHSATYNFEETPQKLVYSSRKKAIDAVAATCRHNLQMVGELSEMQVRRLDGQWAKEKRTYGKDPEGRG